MSILSVNHLTKQFGERTLFSDVSFELMPGDRCGLVGVNGCGKSTLLKIITGQELKDGGSVSFSAECRIAYLEQNHIAGEDITLYEETLSIFQELLELERRLEDIARRLESGPDERLIRLQDTLNEQFHREGGLTFRSRTRAVLMGIGFSEQELAKPVRLFSGGEARKALLAKVLLSDANLLLLDEPTNHLDLRAIEWLEEFLLAYKGAYLVVSHDRYFLDRVTTRTIEMENGHVSVHRGNYSRHIELKLSEREVAERVYLSQQKEIRRIQGIIEQQRRWNQARNYVTIAAKEKQIERIKAEMVKPEKEPGSIGFRFQATEPAGNDIIITKELEKSFGDKLLFSGIDMHVLKGEHICILGANGCGKSTLLNILRGEMDYDHGSVRIGANVKIGYYEQNMQGFLPGLTVLEQVSELFPRLDLVQLRTALGRFLFHGDDVFKKMGELSGGELARIQMLKLMLEGCNLLLLDEPTNHLDIPSMEALEKALSGYDGTMLVVTHDRYFVDRIADRVLILSRDSLQEFPGDWSQYMESLKEEARAETRKEKDDAPKAEKNDYLKKKQFRSEYLKAQTAVRNAETQIATLEEKQEALHASMATASGDYSQLISLNAELDQIGLELADAYEEWERLSEELENLKATSPEPLGE